MKESFEKLKGKQANAFGDLPPGYLEQLQGSLDKRLSIDQSATRQSHRRWMLPGVAAVVLIALGSLFMPDDDKTPAERQFAKYESRDTALKNKTASNENIKMKTNNTKEGKLNHDSAVITADSLQQMLESVPLEDIINYLNETEEFEF